MSVHVFDNVLPIEVAKKIEKLVKNHKYGPAYSLPLSGRSYYPFELPKGLKWGEWEPQEGPNRHWMSKHGQDEKSLEHLDLKWIHDLFDDFQKSINLKSKFSIDSYGDAYINVHSHGQEPHIHYDGNRGNMTLLYYPILNWNQYHWGGGTTIWEPYIENSVDRIEELEVLKHVTNRGNRVVLFDAWHWHKAEPVARICHNMRYTITYKTVANGGNNERLDFYNE
tara:strand:- start:119 stop:790 length:672 start_codon:yes stop_codon:yes gene_type:complete